MKRGTPDHPKTARLALALGCHRLLAVGILEMLWHWTARYAPRGDVGRWDNATIAAGILWDGDADQLIAALIETRWLDVDEEHRLLIHDWQQHADDATKKHLSRNNLAFATMSRRRPVKGRTKSDSESAAVTPAVAVAVAIAKPEPLPEPRGDGATSAPPLAHESREGHASDWNREAADDFKAVYGANPPKQFFAQVKAVAKVYGWERSRPALKAYMAETPIEYLNVAKCLAVKVENGGPSKARGQPATANNAAVLDSWEQEVMEGKR